jgi:DNA-directed RNA polymerase III subunit RPC11
MFFDCLLSVPLKILYHVTQVSEHGGTGSNGSRFYCSTCPYSWSIIKSQVSKVYPERKQVDDILGGAAAWENVDRTMAVCPKCNHNEAYFLQMQIRSADEPMSIFYKCVQCGHQWNDK